MVACQSGPAALSPPPRWPVSQDGGAERQQRGRGRRGGCRRGRRGAGRAPDPRDREDPQGQGGDSGRRARLRPGVQRGDLPALQGQAGPAGSDLCRKDPEGRRHAQPARHQGRPDGAPGHQDTPEDPGLFHAGCGCLSTSSCRQRRPRCRLPQPLCSPHFSRGPTAAVHLRPHALGSREQQPEEWRPGGFPGPSIRSGPRRVHLHLVWLWRDCRAGPAGDGLGQLHGAPAADAAAADVQPGDALADHGEPAGAEHDGQPGLHAPDDHGQPPDAAADGAQPGDQPHAQQPRAHAPDHGAGSQPGHDAGDDAEPGPGPEQLGEHPGGLQRPAPHVHGHPGAHVQRCSGAVWQQPLLRPGWGLRHLELTAAADGEPRALAQPVEPCGALFSEPGPRQRGRPQPGRKPEHAHRIQPPGDQRDQSRSWDVQQPRDAGAPAADLGEPAADAERDLGPLPAHHDADAGPEPRHRSPDDGERPPLCRQPPASGAAAAPAPRISAADAEPRLALHPDEPAGHAGPPPDPAGAPDAADGSAWSGAQPGDLRNASSPPAFCRRKRDPWDSPLVGRAAHQCLAGWGQQRPPPAAHAADDHAPGRIQLPGTGPGGAVPATAGAAQRHGVHQPRGQPPGAHRHRRGHQCCHRETAGLPALLTPRCRPSASTRRRGVAWRPPPPWLCPRPPQAVRGLGKKLELGAASAVSRFPPKALKNCIVHGFWFSLSGFLEAQTPPSASTGACSCPPHPT